jgi:hypothetical protein
MIDPRGMDPLDWAATVVYDFPQDPLPVLQNVDAWVPWAQLVSQAPSLRQYEVPDPTYYDDFGTWATDLFKVATT